MSDITKEPYAKWLEEALQSLTQQHPAKIAIVALSEKGDYMSTYYECGPIDLYAMGGSLQADGLWREIRANSNILKQIIEEADSDEGDDDSPEE